MVMQRVLKGPLQSAAGQASMLMVMLQELVIAAAPALVIVMVVALALIGPTQGPGHGSWEAVA